MLGITLKTLARTPRIASSGRYLSILNPVDLREWDDRRAPAYNRFGIAYLRRKPNTFDAPPMQWMQAIEDQLSYVRKRGVGAEWCKGLALLDTVPGLKRLIDRTGAFHPTASVTCLSNLLLGKRYGLVLTGSIGDWTVRQFTECRLTRRCRPLCRWHLPWSTLGTNLVNLEISLRLLGKR